MFIAADSDVRGGFCSEDRSDYAGGDIDSKRGPYGRLNVRSLAAVLKEKAVVNSGR